MFSERRNPSLWKTSLLVHHYPSMATRFKTAVFVIAAFVTTIGLIYYQQHESGNKNKKFSTVKGTLYDEKFDSLISHIRHPSSFCESSIVVGGEQFIQQNIVKLDGDKVICLKPGPGIRENCTVYSFGINNEWSFDKGMEKLGCRVFAFDPSMELKDHQYSKRIWFYNMGIAGENKDSKQNNGITWKLRTLDTIMKMLGHEGQIIDVLKMDVEGSELDALEQMVDSRVLKNVNHLCIEIHLIASYFDRTLNTLQRLENEDNFQFFSSRPNPIVAPMAVPGRYKTEYFLYELAWFKRRT